MRAQELRVGNYIQLESGSIAPIQAGGINAIDQGQLKVKGIELTEEWLVKFGFQKVSERNYQIPANDFDFIINVYYTYSGGAWFIHLNDCRLPYHTVHQLQNLYFALTMEELK